MVYSRVFYTNPDNQNFFDEDLVEIASDFGGRFVEAEDEIQEGVCPDCGEDVEPNIRCLTFEYRTKARRERGERAMELHLVWCDGYAAGILAAGTRYQDEEY